MVPCVVGHPAPVVPCVVGSPSRPPLLRRETWLEGGIPWGTLRGCRTGEAWLAMGDGGEGGACDAATRQHMYVYIYISLSLSRSLSRSLSLSLFLSLSLSVSLPRVLSASQPP